MAKKSTQDAAKTLEEYRALIPASVRTEILTTLLEEREKGFTEFIDMTTYIMAHVLVGNVPVEVAECLKGYLELLFTATTANQLATKSATGKQRVTAEGVALARKAQQAQLEGRVVLEQTKEGLKVKVGVVDAQDEEGT